MKHTYSLVLYLVRNCFLLSICISVCAQDAAFIWAQKFAADSETIRGIAPTTDNAFVTLAGPASGENTISRVTEQGAVVWSVRFPSAAVMATAPDGSIYLGGYAISCLPANCSDPVNRFVAAGIPTEGAGYGYVAKLNPAGGLQWVRLDGKAPQGMLPRGLAIDAQANYYLAGWYNGGPAELGGTALPPGPSVSDPPNSFFAKYDRDGRFEWVRAGVSDGTDDFNNIAVDSSGNLFLSGSFSGTFTIDGQTLTGPASYLLKMSPGGNLLWARELSQDCCSPVKVAVDLKGNAFSAFELENGTLRLSKHNPQGDQLWTRTSGGQGRGYWAGIAVDENGDCVLGGGYGGTLSFESFSLNTVAAYDVFAVKFTGAGEVKWAVSSVGVDPEKTGPQMNPYARVSIARPAAFASNGRGSYLLGGLLAGTTIFGPAKLLGPPYDGTYEQFLTLISAGGSPPYLQILRALEKVIISWPADATDYVLEAADSVSSAWRLETTSPVLSGNQMVVTVLPESNARFFRLKKP
jgi:hypothetical protein